MQQVEILRKIGLVVLAALLALSSSAFTVLYGLESSILNTEFVLGQLEELDAYSKLRGIIVETVVSETEVEDPCIVQALNSSVTEGFLKNSAAMLVNSIYTYIHGGGDLRFEIRLENVKDKLAKHAEECLLEGSRNVGNVSESQLRRIVRRQVEGMVSEMPDEVNETLLTQSDFRESLDEASRIVGIIDLAYAGSVVASIVLSIALAVLSKPRISSLKNISISVLIGGLIPVVGFTALENFVVESIRGIPMPNPYVAGLAQSFVKNVVGHLRLTALGIAGLGALLLVSYYAASRIIERRYSKATTWRAVRHLRNPSFIISFIHSREASKRDRGAGTSILINSAGE